MKKIRMITFFLLPLFVINLVHSEEKNATQSGPMNRPSGFHFSLGFGFVIKNNFRKNNTYNNTHGDVLFSPLPLIELGYGPFSFGGQGLKLDLYGNRQWGLYTNLDRVRERYHGREMDDRRDSWFYGLGGRYGKFSLYLAKDIQGRSKGKKASLNYSQMYSIHQKYFTRSSIGLECFDKNYSNYYFGVKASEVRDSRPLYEPTSFCRPTLSFAPMKKVDDHLTYLTALSIKYLPSEIRHSPTVKGGNIETGLIFGGLYQF